MFIKNKMPRENYFDEHGGADSCGLCGLINTSGGKVSMRDNIAMATQMEQNRGNGLGGGFAIYDNNLFEDNLKGCYVLQFFLMDGLNYKKVKRYLTSIPDIKIIYDEEIPTKKVPGISPPGLHRFFIKLNTENEQNIISDLVMKINKGAERIEDAWVFSSGKNMLTFKGVGYPSQIAEFFRIEELYPEVQAATAHSRFPTNTPGWWGGSHPFTLLDWSVIHNGEISSYGTNKRYLESSGYVCNLGTDTEVLVYLFDLLVRKHEIPIEIVSHALSPPFWDEINRMSEKEKRFYTALRQTYSSALVNGPWTIIIGFSGKLIPNGNFDSDEYGLGIFSDRIKLRPAIVAKKNGIVYFSSEESAISSITSLDNIIGVEAGRPIIATTKGYTLNLEEKDELNLS